VNKPSLTLHTTTMTRADQAVVGFLARYSSPGTIAAFGMDLRLLFDWCKTQDLDPLDVTRVHLEMFARHLETDRGNCPSTIHRRLSTLKCFYRLAEIDQYVDRDPAVHLRLPRLYRDETKTLGLDRLELGAVVAAARASTPSDAALITMLGLLGLRVSEACNVRIEDIHGMERGHRTLTWSARAGSRRRSLCRCRWPGSWTLQLATGKPARCCCVPMATRWTGVRRPGLWFAWPRRSASARGSVRTRSGMPTSRRRRPVA